MKLASGVTDHLGRSVDVSAVSLVRVAADFSDATLKFFTAAIASTVGTIAWPGGECLVAFWAVSPANWGGGNVQLAYSPDNGTTYIDTDGALFTANATLLMAYPAGALVRATFTKVGACSVSGNAQPTR